MGPLHYFGEMVLFFCAMTEELVRDHSILPESALGLVLSHPTPKPNSPLRSSRTYIRNFRFSILDGLVPLRGLGSLTMEHIFIAFYYFKLVMFDSQCHSNGHYFHKITN